MSRHAVEAKMRLDDAERVRERVKRAMHRASESDIDVAHDRPDLRIRAAVEVVLDEFVDDRREWFRQAEEMDAQQAAAQAEAARR